MLAAAAFFDDPEPSRAEEADERTMGGSRETVRAEIGAPEVHAQSSAAEEGGDRSAQAVSSPEAGSARTVDVEVRYAEASVAVATDNGTELRRCSVCMN